MQMDSFQRLGWRLPSLRTFLKINEGRGNLRILWYKHTIGYGFSPVSLFTSFFRERAEEGGKALEEKKLEGAITGFCEIDGSWRECTRSRPELRTSWASFVYKKN